MTIDGHKPTKEEHAIDNLDTDLRLDVVLTRLTENGVLPAPDTGDEDFSIVYDELAREMFEVVENVFSRRAEDTQGWSNGKDPMDPAHTGETVAEAVSDDLIGDVAEEKTEELLDEFRSRISNNVYSDEAVEFEVTDIPSTVLPASVFN